MSVVLVAPLPLAEFNAAAESDAHGVLGSCLDIDRWVLEVDAGRPYADWESLRAKASASADAITWDEVAGALARHPRIGERATGGGTAASFSRDEQSASASEDAELAAALEAGNRAYEERFGRVFLIRAAGRDRRQILDELHRRLQLDPAREMATVASELRDIALFRIPKLFDRPAPQPEPDPTT